MSKILNKADIVAILVSKGYTYTESVKYYDDFLGIVRDTIVNGNAVKLSGIGRISGIIKPEHDTKVCGKDITVPKSLKIKLIPSRRTQDKFKRENSKEAKKKKSIQTINNLLS